MTHYVHEAYGECWHLHPNKAAFLPKHKTLIISDLHLGKLSHFRRAGIGVPDFGEVQNFQRIRQLLAYFDCQKIILLGDLFHSEKNRVWDLFKEFIEEFESREFNLVLGNHDIFLTDQFEGFENFSTCERLEINKLIFTHEPLLQIPDDRINICGHIHPAVILKGKGRQTMRIPCFSFGSNKLIFPAFGSFTGTYAIEHNEGDVILGIIDTEIIPL